MKVRMYNHFMVNTEILKVDMRMKMKTQVDHKNIILLCDKNLLSKSILYSFKIIAILKVKNLFRVIKSGLQISKASLYD